MNNKARDQKASRTLAQRLRALPGYLSLQQPKRATRLVRKKTFLSRGLIAAACALVGVASALADGRVTVKPARGGEAIPATTAGGDWTTLAGPFLIEGDAGAITPAGTIVLTVPAGFEFNPAATVTVLVNGGAGPHNINGVANGGTIPVAVTSTTLTLDVTSRSSGGDNANWLTFQGIQVRPTATSPLAGGDLTESGTCGFQELFLYAGTWGFLREVGGPLAGYQLTGPASGTAGSPISITIQKVDEFGNPLSDDTPETLIFSGVGTIGTYAPTVNGSPDAFTTGIPVTFDGNGSATVTLVDYLAETATLNVTDGTSSSVTGLTIAIVPGPVHALVIDTAPVSVFYGSTFDVGVQATDQYGNPSTSGLGSSVNVTLTLASGPGSLSGVLMQDVGTSAGNGTASFTGLQISDVGIGDVLSAGAAGFISGTTALTVLPLVVNPAVVVGSKIYDGTTDALITGRSLPGTLAGDDVSLGQSGVAAFADKHVGPAKPVTVTGLSLTGSAAANYLLSTTSTSAAAAITARSVSIAATPQHKTYDGTTASSATPTLCSGSLAGGDTAQLSQRFDSRNAGTGKTLIPAGSIADGNGGNNYLVTFVNSTNGAILPASSTVALSSSQNPIVQGSSVGFTATVSPVAPAATTPTGSVQFYANGQPLGGAVALNAGVATLSTTQLSAGSNTISSIYLGDQDFLTSSTSLMQAVQMDIQTVTILSIVPNGDGTATITCQGVPATVYWVQATPTLNAPITWETVSTNTSGYIDGQWTYVDDMTQHPQRFFRAALP